MGTDYVQQRAGTFYLGASRVTLDSIILHWRAGERPEEIHEGYPSVSLAAIYGTIAYYLEHQDEVDAYLRQLEELWREGRARSEAAHPAFYARLRQRRAEEHSAAAPETESRPESHTA